MCAPLTVFVPADPNLPVPAGYGLTKGEGEGSPLTLMVPGGRSHLPGGGGDPPGLGQGGPNDPLNPANIPLPGEVPALAASSPSQGQEGTPPHGAKLLSIPLPGEAAAGEGAAVEGGETPSAITIHLPPRWRLARDATGHVYFYHTKTRVSQWEPPAMLNSALGSDSSSESSSDSDSDSSSTTDVSTHTLGVVPAVPTTPRHHSRCPGVCWGVTASVCPQQGLAQRCRQTGGDSQTTEPFLQH